MVDPKQLYQPPKWAVRLLGFFCKDELLEEIEGDLFEHYQELRARNSKLKAGLAYWFHLFNFLRPFAIKKLGQNSNFIIMYRSYFKFAWRNMLRKKWQTGFHILSLVLAFTVCGLIYLHLNFETSFDSFHDDADDIYRVAFFNDNPQTRTPHPLAQAMVNDFPEVTDAVSLSPIYGPGLTKTTVRLTHDSTNITHDVADGFFVDSTFFDVFSFKALQGKPKEALTKEWAVVLSESTAKRFFGDKNPVGERLTFNGMVDILEVAAVVEDAPINSHFHYNFMISYVTLKALDFNDPWLSWDDFGHFNYLKLNKGAKAEQLQGKIPEWAPKYLNWSEEDFDALRLREHQFALQPIQDIHLHSNIRWELESNGSFNYLMIYGVSALFILLISIINFVNLNTARAAERLKEVGVKRTLGAERSQIFAQFTIEALLTAFLALAISVFMMNWLEPRFNILFESQIDVNDLTETQAITFLLSIVFLTSIVSALYPSVYLNSFAPGKILRGLKLTKIGGANLRNGLLIVQLVAAILMISGSMVIKDQIKFLNDKDLGFEKDNIVLLEINDNIFNDKIDALKNELAAVAGVNSVSAISNVPGGQFNQHPIYLADDPQQRVDATEMFVDEDLKQALELQLVDGRMLDEEYAADSSGTSFVLNETAISDLNLEEPVGKELFWVNNEELVKGRIVGVVKDFHFNSLHVPIRPLIMMLNDNNYNYLMVNLNANNLQFNLSKIEESYLSVVPEADFSYQFLDQQIEDLYQQEVQTLKLTIILSTISIFLACGGLLGIVSIVVKQRMKEISIRKVLGASVQHILWLMNVKYFIVFIIALFIAVPISIMLMNDWLGNFNYQAGVAPLIYLITGGGVILLISLTISLISMGTIRRNPAETLRNE